jgi:hypothetical protein
MNEGREKRVEGEGRRRILSLTVCMCSFLKNIHDTPAHIILQNNTTRRTRYAPREYLRGSSTFSNQSTRLLLIRSASFVHLLGDTCRRRPVSPRRRGFVLPRSDLAILFAGLVVRPPARFPAVFGMNCRCVRAGPPGARRRPPPVEDKLPRRSLSDAAGIGEAAPRRFEAPSRDIPTKRLRPVVGARPPRSDLAILFAGLVVRPPARSPSVSFGMNGGCVRAGPPGARRRPPPVEDKLPRRSLSDAASIGEAAPRRFEAPSGDTPTKSLRLVVGALGVCGGSWECNCDCELGE